MIKTPALLIAAASALVTATACSVIALAFAVFALLRPHFGVAGTYAFVALIAAFVAGAGAFLLRHHAKADSAEEEGRAAPTGVLGITDLIRSRPGAALGVSLVLGLLASRYPRFALEMVTFAQRLTQPPQR